MLLKLTKHARGKVTLVVAGDFNALAVERGSIITNARGAALLSSFANLDFVLLNSGRKPTFIKGRASPYIDLTFASSWIVS